MKYETYRMGFFLLGGGGGGFTVGTILMIPSYVNDSTLQMSLYTLRDNVLRQSFCRERSFSAAR